MAAEKPDVLDPETLQWANDATNALLLQLDRILLGRGELHRMVLTGVLSRGHILLEGVPGIGKTALVKALSQLFGLDFNRVQFTPDLMPSDILGTHILQQSDDGRRDMVFHPGPVFANILLADEINRASPKTQSALLEAMQERAVTIMGQTRVLPHPFFVLASQNPIELEGTYPLPEAQLDRFMFRLLVHDVDADILDSIIGTRRHGTPPEPTYTMSADDLERLFAAVDRVFLPRPVARYVARLVAATHPAAAEASAEVKNYVSYGASPRAAISIAEASRAHALLAGRPTVGFEDVKAVAVPVLNHRLVLDYKAKFDRVTGENVAERLMSGLNETGMDLPDNIEVAIE